MRFFLDTADPDAVTTWRRCGVIAGVTTNPTLIRRANVDDGTLAKLIALARPLPVSVQVAADTEDDAVREGMALAALGDNVVVKVPVVDPHGRPALPVVHHLASRGVAVNATACLSAGQAILAATAGAAYVSLLAGRIEDEGGDSVAQVRAVRRWTDAVGSATRLIVGSVRDVATVNRMLPTGAHILTVPPEVLGRLADHRYARETARQFLDHARNPEVP